MEAFMLADWRTNINIWDIPVLYGDTADILGTDGEKELPEDRPHTSTRISFSTKDQPTFGLPSDKRDSLPIIHVKGSHYEIGYKIGRTFSSMIRDFVENHPDVALYSKVYETPKGKQIYDSCYDAVSRFYPEYMRELSGIATGAGLPFAKVFLMHMEDIMGVAVPPGEQRPMPSRGSTTLVVTDQNHQLMGQVVDTNAVGLTNLYIVKAVVTERCPPQEFTALCIGGMLPGSNIGFNENGMVFAVDPVPIRKCNECGIPRSVLCRDLLSATDTTQVGHILKCDGCGIGNGVSVLCAQLGIHSGRSFTNYEAAPRYPAHSSSCVSRHDISPPKTNYYYHMNKFHQLPMVQEVVHNTYTKWILSKKKVLLGYENVSGQKFVDILGDSSNQTQDRDLKNIFTSAVSSCGLVTVAVGVFDLMDETLTVYTDNPSETTPLISGMPLTTK